MYDFHQDKQRYFEMQRRTAAEHILPFIGEPAAGAVLEVGCAEAGVLKAFLDAGWRGTGIELSPSRSAQARTFLAEEITAGRAQIRNDNIYDVEPQELMPGGYDLIVLKDVIEHIPEQERIIPRLAKFLAPGGRMFFGFPPWRMPFGGHQQIADSPLLGKLPWVHLLPRSLYHRVIRAFGESDLRFEELEEIRATGLSTRRFERIIRESELHIDKRRVWLFNPIYAQKFGLPVREQIPLLARNSLLRDFTSTAVYYLISDPRGRYQPGYSPE